MVENKENDVQKQDNTVIKWFRASLHDLIAGFCIGVGFIIPGFSGGSIAAIMGVYEKMINAVYNIARETKKSLLDLLPIGIGLAIGAVSFLFPLSWALSAYPLPTVSLFVGLAIGGLPTITKEIKGRPSVLNILAFAIPFILSLLICFLPTSADIDLFSLNFGGYVLLFFIGLIGSCALIVPGISGSMLLLVIGYYNPLVQMITGHLLKLKDLGKSILVLGTFGVGMLIGCVIVSVIMKVMLDKYPRGTYFAIVGFVVGSLPAVYVSTMKDAGMLDSAMQIISLPESIGHYIACAALLIVGFILAFAFVKFAEKKEHNAPVKEEASK